jgi:hypothetical protein
LQISPKIDYKIFILIGLLILWQPVLNVTAQAQVKDHTGQVLSTTFIKQDISQKTGQLSFNVVRIRNLSDTAIRFKPIFVLPADWIAFSPPFRDTIVQPNDSVSLSFRFQLPEKARSDIKHDIIFRAYSMQNKLLSESKFSVHPEAFHDWSIDLPDKRTFFYPRMNQSQFELHLSNKGNTSEVIKLDVVPDEKLVLSALTVDWKSGQDIALDPYQDTIIKFNVRYNFPEYRVFDISKVQIKATSGDVEIPKALLLEKYNSTYSPFYVDRNLPHQVEIGIRTFSGNEEFLPFIKARGYSTINPNSSFIYNFNYYSTTGNENIISNSYYNLLYNWKQLKVGLGAYSSELGRNLYTRHGVMVSDVFKINPALSLEAFVSQSFYTQKTSIAAGAAYEKKKFGLHGSVAYDMDAEKKANTGSVMLQSNLITLAKGHDMRFNLYGYDEYHYLTKSYTMAGVAWDINYIGRFGDYLTLQAFNNYGSPNIPGPQMGLLSLGVTSIFNLGNVKKYFSLQYINSSKKYHGYSYEGFELPDAKLYDQYANLFFHSRNHPGHTWDAGPSVEFYHSILPPSSPGDPFTEYTTQKLRLEYKGIIAKVLNLNLKTGLANMNIKEKIETNERKYDVHLLGGFNFLKGYSLSVTYDYGPMVNSGLYQFAGDVNNHSISVSPGLTSTYFKERVNLNIYANYIYRFDLQYTSFNINPKIEIFLIRDWYVIASGTYHYTQQEFTDFQKENSYTYFEFSIKKRWGKSDANKWQKDTRRLKIVLFKDDNGNGVKDDNEKGMPNVKTRLRLTNTDDPNFNPEFPVDIILLTNSAGAVNYNRIPKGFYQLNITPLDDVKEYFYVDRSAESLEVTKNATYYIPFQKANKITGKIVVQRQKFIKAGQENIDLTNIKVTAYNKQGNSYSSFSLEDGSFTIFLPGNNTYYVRMGNVFGPAYKIMQNDIKIVVPDSTNNQVVFNVNEINRQVKFKEAKPKPAPADSLMKEPLKIKILHGKFYENSNEAAIDKNAVPEFNIKEAPVPEQNIIPGNYYVVVGTDSSRTQSVKIKRIIEENGVDCLLGYNQADGKYYVFTKYFQNKSEAKAEEDRLKKAGILDAQIVKFE